MKYLQLTSTYAPAWGFGGPIRLMFEYAAWMSESTDDVLTITSNLHHDFKTSLKMGSEQVDGANVRRVRMFFPRLARRNINLVSPAMLFRAVREVSSFPGMVVLHVCELRGLVPFYALLLRKLFGKKVILVHSAFGMLHEKTSRRRDWYDKVFLPPFLRSIDLALAQNQHEAGEYARLFLRNRVEQRRVELLNLPAPAPANATARSGSGEKEAAQVRSLREKYSVPEDSRVLLFLGRFHPEKGLLRVLETFRALRSSGGGPWKLLLVGRDDGFQGALEGEIRKWKLENEARIVTNVYEERFEFYRLASVFVGFPTMYEETMLSAVEALQCGTPVVVSREADMPFVDEAGAGFVIDYSCDEAAHKVAQVLNDLPGYERRAFSLAESQYSSQKSAGLFRGYLESQVRAHRGPAGGER